MRPRVPKLCGADIELGNFILRRGTEADVRHRRLPSHRTLRGHRSPVGTGPEAAVALLREIDGVPGRPGRDRRAWIRRSSESGRTDGVPTEWGQTYLPRNGGCAYIDLDHLELCLPEVTSARDHVACWHAMLRIARDAQVAADATLPEGSSLQVLVNNSDGLGHSYGSHLDFLVTRRMWDDLFHRKLHHLALLAAYQVSSIVWSGLGKVGSENGAPRVPYQLSQRADFFETLVGTQTTYRRPIVNRRDEPLCGRGSDLARLHVIFFDNSLCPIAALLKVGATQIVLAMLEAGRIDTRLALDDPLAALRAWSADPGLEARQRLVSGASLTAVELQLAFFERAQRFVESGACEGLVPGAEEIVGLWGDTLEKLRTRDLDALAGRLDWVLKLSLLERARARRPDLAWDGPQLKHLDHLYSSLDPSEGLYWAVARHGGVEEIVSSAEVERFLHTPPEDTRAWGRAMWLRRLGAERVEEVHWDFMRVRPERSGRRGSWFLDLADPLGSTRAELEPILGAGWIFGDDGSGAGADRMGRDPRVMALLEAAGATREPPRRALSPAPGVVELGRRRAHRTGDRRTEGGER